ncbi:MAG: gyrase subunit [Candidatus Midichloriaceae bacterium]|nr:gyrase subunit [Candidatus Midichloriaceae bacterium]
MTHQISKNTVSVSIESQMKRSYLDYAMSVIVSRALPDCRDGLKPVHRRILFAMHHMNNYHDKPHKKSARIVGEVIGKYHPHGDAPIYGSLVRMAQEFSLRDPLVDGQGNFGSIDGDSPAAMRYTEARLSKIAARMLDDIDQETVDFQDNYDGSESEPKVLPARFPNLLVNGTSGIAVGMATNIPTHNLGEVIDACLAYIQNPEITSEELVAFVPAPDFPTGGMLVGATQARNALISGKGIITMRGRTEIEEIGGTFAIIIKELPYQVNKSELVKKIEHLSKDKVIEGISELRDESNKLGIRVVIELKRDATPDVIINQLYKHSELQTSFGVNMLALNNGNPILMGLREIISAFVDFRREIVTRRTIYQLNKARNKAHVLIGLSLAVANIDEVIALIKASPNPQEAKKRLMDKHWQASDVIPLLKLVDDYRNELVDNKCRFTQEQAEAILEMRLSKLTGLEKEKIENDLGELAKVIAGFLELLASKEKILALISKELQDVRDTFATPRRTEIILDDREFNDEDLIAREEMVVTNTMGGFIKRVPLDTYRAQRRGGKGRSGMAIYSDDTTTDIIVANTHVPLLFFSSLGKVYRMKVYKLPLGSPQSKGKALINMLPLAPDERITNIMPLPENPADWLDYSIVFSTEKGNIRRNELSAFSSIQANGKIAMKLDEDDRLVGVSIARSTDHILLCTRYGKALRFPLSKLRIFKSRNSDGVRGIKFAHNNDAVVSMAILSEARASMEEREEFLRIPVDARLAYKNTQDAEQFKKAVEEEALNFTILTMNAALELAAAEQFILTVTENGYGKRTSIYEYRITGRGGQGILNIDTSERNGLVIASLPVESEDQVILLTSGGTLIRTKVIDIRITGRNAKGVKIMNAQDGEKVISVTRVLGDGSSEDSEESENIETDA